MAYDPRPEYNKAWEEWVAANPGRPVGEFKSPGPDGLSPYDQFTLTQPGGREQLIKEAEAADSTSRQNASTFKSTVGAIPLVGGLVSGLVGMASAGPEEQRRKRLEALKGQGDPGLAAFIAELQKPIDWNSPETKMLLTEAQGATRRDASNRGLSASGISNANTEQAVANAQAKYGLQRKQLLSQALQAQQSGNTSAGQLDLMKQQYAGTQQANADRNTIATVGGLAQTGQTLYTNWQGNNGGLGVEPGLAAPQPTTGASSASNVPGSYYNAPTPTNEGLSSTPSQPVADTGLGTDPLRNA